jgi:hypothetical protein
MKVRPVVTQLFHLDGWTDMTKLSEAFRYFVTASKHGWIGIGVGAWERN